MAVFDAGLTKFPNSSRLMLERGIGALNWNDFKTAKEWARRAKENATENIRTGHRTEGMDDEESVVEQAESLLKSLKGS